MRELDERFLRRALQLAERARGHTHPNPLVGAVLVREGRVVGEGYHPRAGEAHAEVLALSQAGELARGATAYVSLEPCAHFGRTPPCSLALLQAGVARVVVAAREENPLAQGGLERLRAAGVAVEAGLLEAEARAQNEVFFHVQKTGRPFVLLKAALTLDGKAAAPSGDARWVSSEASRRVAQAYRQGLPAVAVGVGTVLQDDPALTVREPDFRPFPLMLEPPPLRDPAKVVLDTEARTPPTARLFRPGPRGEPARVYLLVGKGAPKERLAALERAGARVVELPREGGRVSLEGALGFLLEEGLDGVLLEAGPTLAGAFLARGLVDKLALFLAPKLLGEGRGLAEGLAVERVAEARKLRLTRREWLEEDLWLEGYLEV
ncbi:bifunctional diaminohydroxyphosphoribosylaminopyrimidine deaminase/5-amino-6-(5-phosphoribosylamino)uracil reductase RibD [Thermus thermamylovorans]|uniref:Riboflavin biosynthesis protein RibD n=1 Tax=Thermus thermamylovorans TaxID=2509362 RepID=A0A4Q9B6F0_9DEIN|nr:bifunctional diaminohydroxyphosphoribosylaminopyrimidine deaminase/5-amino-6-(5-phosphoribosylamino)uracil reductase RibD [Thermus thermamylovorans]TBH21542.1 bifunctional diaminohydroxyphosphoribosylaminopyrimidine deaminase/5-amino-6-(5-phosphoribosylamino)uracil reductase RibD [Thermus thermamylovorans]